MENEVIERKASEILLDLEAKVNLLLDIVRAQNLTISILSNRVLAVQNSLKGNTIPKITVEAVAKQDYKFPEPQIITKEENPEGERRTARPETYAKIFDERIKAARAAQAAQVGQPGKPGGITQEVPKIKIPPPITRPEIINQEENRNLIPIKQMIIDQDGKSIFMADIEITNLRDSNMASFRIKTNGAGNWTTKLAFGDYRIKVAKQDKITRKMMELIQEITIDGSQNPVELATVVLKPKEIVP